MWVRQGDEGEGPWLRGDCLVKQDSVHGASELQLNLFRQCTGAPIKTGGRGKGSDSIYEEETLGHEQKATLSQGGLTLQ